MNDWLLILIFSPLAGLIVFRGLYYGFLLLRDMILEMLNKQHHKESMSLFKAMAEIYIDEKRPL